ncbi:MAG: metallophosphoesterase [Parachlamydiales bacterium]|jgi:hypothetical protein
MNVFAISDLHLSLSVKEKSMEVFSQNWKDYQEKIKDNWQSVVSKNDLVLIAGDICWAMLLKDALIDLEWLHDLNGKKVIIKGNHDYWWPSLSKLSQALPSSISALHNNSLSFDDIAIAGTRLWDCPDYNFNEFINFTFNPKENHSLEKDIQKELSDNIFQRELIRLKLSLDQMDKTKKHKIVMTHYPPIGADLKDSQVSKILENHKIDIAVFGHLHNVKKNVELFGEKNNIKYILTSSDYLDFEPIKIL